ELTTWKRLFVHAVVELYFGISRCAQPLTLRPSRDPNPPAMSLIPFAPLLEAVFAQGSAYARFRCDRTSEPRKLRIPASAVHCVVKVLKERLVFFLAAVGG